MAYPDGAWHNITFLLRPRFHPVKGHRLLCLTSACTCFVLTPGLDKHIIHKVAVKHMLYKVAVAQTLTPHRVELYSVSCGCRLLSKVGSFCPSEAALKPSSREMKQHCRLQWVPHQQNCSRCWRGWFGLQMQMVQPTQQLPSQLQEQLHLLQTRPASTPPLHRQLVMQAICVLIVILTAALPAMSVQHQKHRQQRAHQRQL